MFTHLDETGRVKMVDVSGKPITRREATAGGEIKCAPEVITLIAEDTIKKGAVFAAARIAGIMAAKKTPELIPLCHGIALQSVEVEITAEQQQGMIAVRATAVTEGKTGVEMEALTAVTGACLCIYDMCKAVDKSMVIGNIRLLHKLGGRSGDYYSD